MKHTKPTRKELLDYIQSVAQNLGDWKPDMRLAYGLQYLFDRADQLLIREEG